MVKRICTVLLFLVVVSIHQLMAQSIRGKIIYVHPSQVVKFKFKSAVDNYSFVNRDDQQLFTVRHTSKNLWITSLSPFKRSSNLVITEGGNTHLFILMYKDHLDEGSEVYYDFSNRKNADALVKNNSAGPQYVSSSSDGGKGSSDGVRIDQNNVEKKPDASLTVMSPGTQINAAPASQKTTPSSDVPVDQKTDGNDFEKKPTGSITVLTPGTKINAAPATQKTTQSSDMPVDQKADGNVVEKKPTGSPTGSIIVMSPGTKINAASPSQKTTQSSTKSADQKTVPNDAEKKPEGSIIVMSPGTKINTNSGSAKTTQSSSTPVDQKTNPNAVDKKPAGSIIIMSPGVKVNTTPASQKPARTSAIPDEQKSTNAQNATSNTAAGKNTAGVAMPSSQKSVSSTEKLPNESFGSKPMVEATPSWTDSVRYELYIEAGDSLAWIVKDYTNALKWYDSALRIRPNAALPKKQIKAVKQLQAQSDQLVADKAKKDRFEKAMAHYRKADALKAQRKYAEAHAEYTKCLDAADTTRLSDYTSAELYYIKDAKDYVARLQHYLPKPVVNTPPPPAAVETDNKKKGKKSRG